MGFLLKINTLIILLLLPFSVHTQVVKKINIESNIKDTYSQILINFWKDTHNFNEEYHILKISDLSLRITNKEGTDTPLDINNYIALDSTYIEQLKKIDNIVGILANGSDEFKQIFIINRNYLYLVDMKNPLQIILDSIASINDFSEYFRKDIFSAIINTHKSNWYLHHSNDNKMDNEIIFDENLNIKIDGYNPFEW